MRRLVRVVSVVWVALLAWPLLGSPVVFETVADAAHLVAHQLDHAHSNHPHGGSLVPASRHAHPGDSPAPDDHRHAADREAGDEFSTRNRGWLTLTGLPAPTRFIALNDQRVLVLLPGVYPRRHVRPPTPLSLSVRLIV